MCHFLYVVVNMCINCYNTISDTTEATIIRRSKRVCAWCEYYQHSLGSFQCTVEFNFEINAIRV